jgi:hypothetical protein
MIKLIDLLEAKQVGTLYHWTNLESLIDILKSNKLKANITDDYYDVDFRAQNNPSFKAKPHVSFTRIKDKKAYGNDHIWAFPCALEIDGNKLSNNYKIVSYSMMSNPKIKAGQYINPEDDDTETYQAEFEERVYSDITNLNRYIVGIVIDKYMLKSALELGDISEDMFNSLKEYLKKNNIPIRYTMGLN